MALLQSRHEISEPESGSFFAAFIISPAILALPTSLCEVTLMQDTSVNRSHFFPHGCLPMSCNSICKQPVSVVTASDAPNGLIIQ